MMRAPVLCVAMLSSLSALASEPRMTPREHNGDWMLMLSNDDQCHPDKRDVTLIHLGLSRIECVRALGAAGAVDLSPKRYEWQSPDPVCLREGKETGRTLTYTYCKSVNGFLLGTSTTSTSFSCIKAGGSCTNVQTGDKATDLRIDDMKEIFP